MAQDASNRTMFEISKRLLSVPGVYKIPCSCGAVYIGQTKIIKRYLRLGQMDKAALAHHGCSTGHVTSFNVIQIFASIPSYDVRLARESLEIHLTGGGN